MSARNHPSFNAPALRLVHPPRVRRDYSRLGEAMVRLAQFAATYHMAQAPRFQIPHDVPAPQGLPRAITPTGIHLKLIPAPEAPSIQESRR